MANGCPNPRKSERGPELARLHAGSVVEPNPNWGVASDDIDGNLLQCLVRLLCAARKQENVVLRLPLVVSIALFLIGQPSRWRDQAES